jgi:hypothetical protein
MTHQHTIVVLTTLVVSACGGRPPVDAPPAPVAVQVDTDYLLNENLPPKFFRTSAGLEVEIVYLEDGPGGEGRALCRLKGTAHPLAGKSLLLTGVVVRNYYTWSLLFDDRPNKFLWVTRNVALNSHVPKFVMSLPRDPGFLKLEYDAERSREIDPQELISIHKGLIADGTIARLEALDEEFYISNTPAIEANATRAFEQKCGRALPIEIDWKSAFKAKRHSFNTCDFVFKQVANLCKRDYDSRRIVNERVTGVSCAFGDTSQVALDPDGTMAVQVGEGDKYYTPLYDDMVKLLSLTNAVGESADGRIVVIDPDPSANSAYLGDGKVMHELARVRLKTSHVWAPNSAGITYRTTPEGIAFHCSKKRQILFKPVSDARRRDILQNAKYEPALWQREAFGLARDDQGTYYYVDHKRKEFGGKDFRVFIGPRGRTKATKLLDVVDDSNGRIFATKSGKLRLILDFARDHGFRLTKAHWWVAKKKKVELVILPISKNKQLIYKELGVYDADYFGTPCE